MENAPQKPISIQPKSVFGLRTDIIGNIHFAITQEVIYPVSGVLSIQDCFKNKQKFLRFPEKCRLESIVISPNRKFMAITEYIAETSYVNIYEVSTLKKRKSITIPSDCPTKAAGRMCFTHDSKAIAFLTKEPDAFLCIFMFDKAETVFTGRASNSNQVGRAEFLACNPGDASIVAIGGDHLIKVMNKTEKGFGQIGAVKGDGVKVTSLAWISGEVLIVGTASNELWLVEGGDLKAKFVATEVECVDLSKIQDEDSQMATQSQTSLKLDKDEERVADEVDVMCLTSFSQGFAFAIHNVVLVFEKETQFRFVKKSLITVPVTLYAEKLYKITNIAINAQQDTIVVTTLHPQIYIGCLYVPETLKITEMSFKLFGEALHIDQIIDLSVCSWKSIVMTASKDQMIRIWNYKTMKIELIKQYQVDISVIALHPSGMFVAIGFTDQLRFLQIQLTDLQLTRTFNCPNCSFIMFSHQGHLLAAAYEKRIDIISIFTFKTIQTLKGHNGKIISVTWSNDDKYLVSAGVEGAIYQWDVAKGTRYNEVIQKGTEYRELALSNDAQSIIAVTNTGYLREMVNSNISREFKVPDLTPLTGLALSRSNAVLFIASEKGHLYNVQLPFADTGGGTCTNFRFFHTSISKICITPDDKLLITAAGDTLVIWTILNNEGKIEKLEYGLGDCVDIMIPRTELLEKNKAIKTLELRIQQQVAEFHYQIKQAEAFHAEKMRDIHKEYCDVIEELKKKNEDMGALHVEELNILTASIAEEKEQHQKALAELEAKFHQKIIVEYEKAVTVKKYTEEMRETYEEKLKTGTCCLRDTISSLEQDFEKQLHERQDLIKQLICELEEKKKDFGEYCKQVEIDNDRNMIEMQLNYEKRLKDESETSVRWRSEATISKNKNSTLTADYVELQNTIATMRGQQSKFQQTINGLEKDINDLKKEISDRDQAIRDKEKRVHDVQKKNQELDKYKHLLMHKIDELKSQIEPRDREIKKRRDQIIEMEKELENLQLTIQQLKLQLSELKDKYHGTDVALKTERNHARSARSHVSMICGDIHKISGYIQKPVKLKTSVKKLYQMYAEDPELKKQLLLKADIQNEFARQREHLEKLAKKTTGVKKKDNVDTTKLLKDNVTLICELNKLRSELKAAQKSMTQMESILGLSNKAMPTRLAKEKLEKAVADTTALEQKHKNECRNFEDLIQSLTTENRMLKLKVAESTRVRSYMARKQE